MEKVDRVRKYSEFIRQQHRNNVIKIHNNSSADDPGTGPSDDTLATEPRQRFTLGDSEKKKLELLERRKKVRHASGFCTPWCEFSSKFNSESYLNCFNAAPLFFALVLSRSTGFELREASSKA